MRDILQEDFIGLISKGSHLRDSLLPLTRVLKYYESRGIKDSFSKNHTTPYSIIALQEMNLAYKYPKIFWNTACLTINAGADEDNENNKTTNYGKIAKAISEIQKRGQKMALPNINKAKFGFSPDLETDEIIFSLKGMCGIGDSIAKAIIDYRPYASLNDFIEKMEQYKSLSKENKMGNSAIIALIKAGCFDKLENKDRVEIMKDFIKKISNPKKSLGMEDIETLGELDLLTQDQRAYELRLYRFRKYITDKKFFVRQDGKSPNTAFYRLERNFAEPFFFEHFENNMVEGKDYEYDEQGFIIVKRGSIELC